MRSEFGHELGTLYDEVHADRGQPAKFPEACPVCGLAVKARESQGQSWEKIQYHCGGGYSRKPQIQTHTDKWWGRCGFMSMKAAVALAYGEANG